MSQPSNQQPQPLPVQPVPAQWRFSALPDHKAVAINITMHIGTITLFASAADAKNLAALLDQAASQAASGLIAVPPGMQLPPMNGNRKEHQ